MRVAQIATLALAAVAYALPAEPGVDGAESGDVTAFEDVTTFESAAGGDEVGALARYNITLCNLPNFRACTRYSGNSKSQ